MRLVGYSDRLSARQGESVEFKVSSEHAEYRVDLVRLIHGDTDPRGPGFKEEVVSSSIAGTYPGSVQPIHTGSCVVVPANPAFSLNAGFTLTAWIFPTTPAKGEQHLLGAWSSVRRSGFRLELDDAGRVALRVGDGTTIESVTTSARLNASAWHFVAAAFDATDGRITVRAVPTAGWPRPDQVTASERITSLRNNKSTDAPFTMASRWTGPGTEPGCFEAFYNGKIDRPSLFDRPLSDDEIATIERGVDPLAIPGAIGVWDFAREISTSRVIDRSLNGLHGTTLNMPTRAMTGANWTGDEFCFRHAPEQYGAIHFHDDDLDDARWGTDFSWSVPTDLPSGVYAARLRAGVDEDHLPVVVRPRAGATTARIAYLMPTFTWLAYADEHQTMAPPEVFPFLDLRHNEQEIAYMAAHKLNSLYDNHSDGSGVCYASWKRPLVNVRPRLIFRAFSACEHFAADLYLIDWMEQKGFTYDVIADENVHTDGADLLANYRVVVTGTHPEYWTTPMLDALQTYLDGGGRVMYLGGNGFYWVTAVDPERPHVIEIRRWRGTETWEAEPGEYYLNTTGEMGGIWRRRNRAPQKMLGVGFTSQGFDYSRPYARQPDSFDPRAGFIFDGVGGDEMIGDFSALTLRHGVAGYEIDRADFKLGTPVHALVVATATGFSDSYQHVIEEVLALDGAQGGTREPLVRADIVYFETANGGGVFSVGSIAWCGGLSANNYENNVSRITQNVLARFASDEPL